MVTTEGNHFSAVALGISALSPGPDHEAEHSHDDGDEQVLVRGGEEDCQRDQYPSQGRHGFDGEERRDAQADEGNDSKNCHSDIIPKLGTAEAEGWKVHSDLPVR